MYNGLDYKRDLRLYVSIPYRRIIASVKQKLEQQATIDASEAGRPGLKRRRSTSFSDFLDEMNNDKYPRVSLSQEGPYRSGSEEPQAGGSGT